MELDENPSPPVDDQARTISQEGGSDAVVEDLDVSEDDSTDVAGGRSSCVNNMKQIGLG